MRFRIKRNTFFLLIMLICMVFIPLLSIVVSKGRAPGLLGESKNRNGENSDEHYFCIFDEAINKTIKIPEKEFIYGTVATEMPASFETEALKAQAVAAYTYFSRAKQEFQKKNGEGEAEFTVNSGKWKYYADVQGMKSKWGDKFEERYNKIKSAVDTVFGQVLEDGDNLILAVYHAMSSGTTEKSKDVFGGDLRYLTNVSSPGDKQAEGYETSAEFSLEEFKEILGKSWNDCNFEAEPAQWIRDIERTDAGMVKSVTICGHRTNGREVRAIFSLRSADFDLAYINEKFTFRVRGHGHGVGMSQYGAQFMAKQGADYKQILQWYYPGTTLMNRQI